MRKLLITLAIAALAIAPAAAQDSTADSTAVNTDSLLNFGMNHILNYMLLTESDFAFRDDFTPKDPYRLKIIDSLMSHPLLMEDFAESCAVVMQNFSGQPDAAIEMLQSLFGDIHAAGSDDSTLGYFEFGELTDEQLKQLYSSSIIPGKDSWLPKWFGRPVEDIDLDFKNEAEYPLNHIVNTAYCTSAEFYLRNPVWMYGGNRDDAGREFLEQFMKKDSLQQFAKVTFPELILDDPDYRKWTNEQLDSIQHVEEEWSKEFAEMGTDITSAGIPAGVISRLDSLFAEMQPLINDKFRKEVAQKTKEFEKKNRPLIAIGTDGNDTYTGDYFMIIDPGGDDVYHLSYDIHNPHPVIIADYAGDDYYTAETDFALACGALDFSLLIDYAGDDIYKAKNFGLGAGYFGVGILWDKKGDDKYFGDTFVEGAGTFGYGLLIDEDGSDVYTANLQSQGFGFVKGIGGIADYAGNDTYTIQPKYKEYFHPGNHYTSLSQGFSIGVRPYMSGGVGFICDYGGNDSYIADFFTQASSYWWSLGMIYDKAGNDLYSSYQYAQGAGAHMTLGMLVDCEGDDIYRSNGVCQGCGHDYSCGWLLDKGGNDVYSAHDLAQGAGQANGIGIFTDLGGDDGYYTHLKYNTQGYGNPRRDYGSIGIFFDLAGDDRYGGNGGNAQYWRVPGKWGGGLDWEWHGLDSLKEGK